MNYNTDSRGLHNTTELIMRHKATRSLVYVLYPARVKQQVVLDALAAIDDATIRPYCTIEFTYTELKQNYYPIQPRERLVSQHVRTRNHEVPLCGLVSKYNQGCRCELCRAARSAYEKSRRHSLKQA